METLPTPSAPESRSSPRADRPSPPATSSPCSSSSRRERPRTRAGSPSSAPASPGWSRPEVASRTAHVTLFEADDRLGGHADTHRVVEHGPGGDRELAIDTGFIVHNQRTYPTLLRLFAELGVATQESEMSMSIRDDVTGVEWAGALGRRGLFPTSDNLRRPAYLRMLTEIPRFHRRARALVAAGDADRRTLREFLDDGGFSAYFTRHFMEPMVAAVWSCDPDVALEYPARYLFAFLDHHGMLGIFGSPTWRTVTGGSREYVARVAAGIDEIRTGTKVTSVLETADGVELTDGNGTVHDLRRRRRRRAPRPGAVDARRADAAATRAARCDAVLAQHRAAAHRHLAAAACRGRPRVVELPATRAGR